ncbi:MAG: type II toxin-antitoxin system VapC family toxin [Candidatus Aenigmarchaeota archaeon]|jgi:predicted nucleic acid-binding protein|nr:type II toxin-antitoxin system VapC family toxin [Candidatus Aenigmarchaeota archaeon]
MDDKILIDTDILIDFLRGDGKTIELINKISAQRLATTDINAFELYHGGYKSKNKQMNIANVEDLLNSLELLSTDRESMRKAAALIADLDKKGASIDIADLFIASICLTNSASLLTRNKKHFERMGVKILA